MHTRVVSFTEANDLDAGVRFVRDQVAPLIRQQHGYRGMTASVDRSKRVLSVLSVWDSPADREASDSALSKTREEGQNIIGGTMTVETFEQLLFEVVEPPTVGSSLLIRRISMDPAKIDANIDFFNREVLPQLKAEPGFRAARNMINRQTGDGIVATIWTDAASMAAAAEAAEVRRQAAQQRVTFGEQSRREIAFADMP
jgi:heme-degrading monooxygenase HmoA